MYMYTTWQTTLLKHMYISKMHTSSQHAICIQFVENTPHTYMYIHCTCTLITLWPMLEDLLLPADPEDRSRESFTVSVSMVKKCKYSVAMPTNPLHDYN